MTDIFLHLISQSGTIFSPSSGEWVVSKILWGYYRRFLSPFRSAIIYKRLFESQRRWKAEASKIRHIASSQTKESSAKQDEEFINTYLVKADKWFDQYGMSMNKYIKNTVPGDGCSPKKYNWNYNME